MHQSFITQDDNTPIPKPASIGCGNCTDEHNSLCDACWLKQKQRCSGINEATERRRINNLNRWQVKVTNAYILGKPLFHGGFKTAAIAMFDGVLRSMYRSV